jgi:hypothetical protein
VDRLSETWHEGYGRLWEKILPVADDTTDEPMELPCSVCKDTADKSLALTVTESAITLSWRKSIVCALPRSICLFAEPAFDYYGEDPSDIEAIRELGLAYARPTLSLY